MKTEKKYEQWKAITESDFVTLFIKTWFTYIAVLRELNPDVKVFTDEGMPRGDKPFLNAFKEGIMPIVQKELSVEIVAQEAFRMYPISMRKVMDVFPQYFFQTFFRVNESFNYSDKTIEKDSDGKIKERYEAHLHIVNRYCLKFYLGVSGCFRTTNYNEEIKKEIDLRPIIEAVVSKHRVQNLYINEIQFMRDFYNGVLKEITGILRHYLDERLPAKGYNQTVNGKIKDACLRLNSALNVKFDYNYKYPHEVGALDDPNSFAIVYQLPFNGFGRVEPDNIYSANEGAYSQLIATKGVDWIANYVYSLRNALFHEIISPLDEEWQTIFKSAYLVLKQISDICISCITRIEDFVQDNNSVLQYAIEHKKDVFDSIADYVELLDFTRMTVNQFSIKDGRYDVSGFFVAKLKLRTGSVEDIEKDKGIIEEADKGFDYRVTLNNDLSIFVDHGNEMISITLQSAK